MHKDLWPCHDKGRNETIHEASLSSFVLSVTLPYCRITVTYIHRRESTYSIMPKGRRGAQRRKEAIKRLNKDPDFVVRTLFCTTVYVQLHTHRTVYIAETAQETGQEIEAFTRHRCQVQSQEHSRHLAVVS